VVRSSQWPVRMGLLLAPKEMLQRVREQGEPRESNFVVMRKSVLILLVTCNLHESNLGLLVVRLAWPKIPCC